MASQAGNPGNTDVPMKETEKKMLRSGKDVAQRSKKGNKVVDLEREEKSGGSGCKNPGTYRILRSVTGNASTSAGDGGNSSKMTFS